MRLRLGWGRKSILRECCVVSARRRKEITSLPMCPLNTKGSGTNAFLKRIAKRGNEWESLCTGIARLDSLGRGSGGPKLTLRGNCGR